METTANTVVKNPPNHSKNQSRTPRRSEMITLAICLTLTAIPVASVLGIAFLGHGKDQPSRTQPGASSLQHLIKTACTSTALYPSNCISSISSLPISKSTTSLHHVLELAVHRVPKLVATTQDKIIQFFALQELNQQEKNALSDCMDMLDQTMYEIEQVMDDLRTFPEAFGVLQRSYSNIKTLLSAAMTNENTCTDGFLDLEEAGNHGSGYKGLRVYLEVELTPISRLISHCLAIIKYMEDVNQQQRMGQPQTVRRLRSRHPTWMTRQERKIMIGQAQARADVVVASDGSGDYKTIGQAVNMAPDMSMSRFVIKVKAGVYKENVEIPRNKINIMLVGEGMSSTVLTSSRGFDDGFSTFESATFTVIGDRFLARDISIVNTAGPEKHQAVAARVTSNSAFYRCNFSSYQDTLYAHSLRQFYRECTIEGTIDFIFGNAAAIFQNCLILVRKPTHGQSNVITAQGREDPNQNTGLSMQNCTIKAASDFSLADRRYFATYLGRPWRNHSRTMVMKSYLGDLIHPQGWCEWDQYSTLDTVEYIEYMNFGRGSGDWLQSTGFPLFHGS